MENDRNQELEQLRETVSELENKLKETKNGDMTLRARDQEIAALKERVKFF